MARGYRFPSVKDESDASNKAWRDHMFLIVQSAGLGLLFSVMVAKQQWESLRQPWAIGHLRISLWKILKHNLLLNNFSIQTCFFHFHIFFFFFFFWRCYAVQRLCRFVLWLCACVAALAFRDCKWEERFKRLSSDFFTVTSGADAKMHSAVFLRYE